MIQLKLKYCCFSYLMNTTPQRFWSHNCTYIYIRMSNEGLCKYQNWPSKSLISYHLTRGSKYLFLQDLQWLYQNRSERHLTVFYINYSVWLCCLLRQYKYYLMRSCLFLLFQTYSVLRGDTKRQNQTKSTKSQNHKITKSTESKKNFANLTKLMNLF